MFTDLLEVARFQDNQSTGAGEGRLFDNCPNSELIFSHSSESPAVYDSHGVSAYATDEGRRPTWEPERRALALSIERARARARER